MWSKKWNRRSKGKRTKEHSLRVAARRYRALAVEAREEGRDWDERYMVSRAEECEKFADRLAGVV